MEDPSNEVEKAVFDVDRSVSDPDDDLLERIMQWEPPSWWITDNTPKSSLDRDTIQAAYAKATTCTVCHNNVWPTRGMDTDSSKLLPSAEEACAGCMILLSVLKICAIRSGSNALFAWRFLWWFKTPKRWVLVFDSRNWEVYVPEDMPTNSILAKDGFALPYQPSSWQAPHLRRELEASPNTGSEHAVGRALAWLRDCEENHEMCRTTNSKLPSRVILIQGPENVKLYESKEEAESYVCLSHCWGKSNIAKTTTSTLDRYKHSIPWHELPLTFQEAISFTFRLGFRYLWIDSLCIQQDSVEDWRNEGSKMARIYSGAFVTLAATAADCSSSGCFRQTPERPSNTYSYPEPGGSRLEVHIRPQLKGEAWNDNSLPLFRRGWTFQECLLSRRMINFTDQELVWGCRTKTVCECSHMEEFYHPENLRSPQQSTSIFHTIARDNPESWHRITEEYSRLKLTFEKDVFPALQGISKEMYQYKKSPYIAGLWQSSIISDLLWRVDYVNQVTRPRQWRAPSWSWASLVGPVTWWSNRETEAMCNYVTARVATAGEDDFGEILSAKITLRGRCIRQDVEGSYRSAAGSYPWIEYPEYDKWETLEQVMWEDCPLDRTDSTRPHSTPMLPDEPVKTLLMARQHVESLSAEETYWLILRLVDAAEHTYERIGMLEITSWDDDVLSDVPLGEEETLHIV